MNSAEEAAQLKDSAVAKLKGAVALLDEARLDMLNLQGIGYPEKYEALAAVRTKTAGLACSFEHLKPPTGLFKF